MIDKPKATDYGYRSWLVVYNLAAKTGNANFGLHKKNEIFLGECADAYYVPKIETIELTLNELKVLAFDELLQIIPNANEAIQYKRKVYGGMPDDTNELLDFFNKFIDIYERRIGEP